MPMNFLRRFLLMLTLLVLALSTSAWATIVDLIAEEVTVNYPGVGNVTMWGFATTAGTGTVPGPALTVSDNELIVNLTNNLSEPVSFILPGQALPVVTGGDPALATMTDSLGRIRAKSFVTPAAAGGGMATYTWNVANSNALRAGTYLYESGSHIGVQVPMGLYGSLAVTGGFPYDGTIPEVTLLFSEVDLAMRQEVISGDYGATAVTPYTTALQMGYAPELLLLNGQPFSSASATALNSGSPAAPGDQILVRLLNAGLNTRSPYLLNMPRLSGSPGDEIQLVALDGNLLSTPRRQSGVELPPGTTRDLLLEIDSASGERYLPIYDRMLGLAHGGMHGFIEIDDPLIAATTLTVTPPTGGTITSTGTPGGISCDPLATDCSETVLAGSAMTLHAEPASVDAALSGWIVTDTATEIPTGECLDLNDCVVTLDANKTVAATFTTYTAVTLLAPNGGEMISPDSAYTIRWGAPAGATLFDLAYSVGAGYPYQSIASQVGGTSYRWDIPADALRTGSVSVAIIGYDSNGTEIGRDASDAFFALTDSLTLIAPNGGEALEDVTFNAATTTDPFTIRWSNRLLGTTVVARTVIWLQTTPGGTWTTVAILPDNPGSYSWDIPATTTSSTARIGIIFYDAAGKVILSDTSDSTFRINSAPAPAPVAAPAPTPAIVSEPVMAAPSTSGSRLIAAPLSTTVFPETPEEPVALLMLLSPNGGEFIPSDTPFTVIWQSTIEVTQYGLEISTDNGDSWSPLGSDILDNQFDWLPDPSLSGASSVLLKVTAYGSDGKPLAEDTSDEVFALE